MFCDSKIEEFRKKLQTENVICITTDIDWASEYAIEQTLNLFKDYNIPITAFATHESNILTSRANEGDYIDLAIHPNFLVNSTQGNTINEIVDYCMKIVPDSRCVRCHRWYSSNDIYDIFVKKGILYDSNECTLLDSISPYFHRSGILRFPTYFEDGSYILHNGNLNFKDIVSKYFDKPGLKVIDLHPMHLMLNTPYFKYTRKIKDELSSEQWNNLDETDIEKLKYNGIGITKFIIELFEFIKKKKIEISTLEKLYNEVDIRFYDN